MQEELEKGSFTLVNDGKEVTYTTFLTFYNKENKKNYVIYTDAVDDSDDFNLYASTYDPCDTEFNLNPVLRDDEWENINSVIDSIISGGSLNEG